MNLNIRAIAGRAAFAGIATMLVASHALAQDGPVPAKPAKPPVQERNLPELPATPLAANDIVYAVKFELEVPYEHNMRKDRQQVVRGHILVLRAPREMLLPRQLAEPVLLVGAQTAERLNAGHGSGHLAVLVPEWTERGADGVERPADPLSARIVFATPELPERVDAAWIAAEQQKAAASGIARRVGPAGEPAPLVLSVRDRDALGRTVADVLERFAPDEADRIRDLRATN